MADSRPTFYCEVTTPERVVFGAEIFQVSIPTREGEITVLAHHLPVVALLAPGEMRLQPKDADPVSLAVSGGFIEVQGNKVTILADTAERAEEIDEARADAARQRAIDVMAERQDDESSAAASAQLEKELARLHVARKHKHRSKGIHLDR